MQMVCISRGSYGYGKGVAERLAEKMNYACISREQITDLANDYGIPVGKLEVEVLKRRPLSEEKSIQMDLFKAFVSARLCEQAMEQNGIIYHGRTGHLVLPGISHVLRIRAIADRDLREWMAVKRMNMSREKVKTYVEQVDDDIRRWVRLLYNKNWEDPSLYDVTINATHLSAENAAAALLQFAGLPEFWLTPASIQTVRDLLLASRCRLSIGKDDRTRRVKATVSAEKGNVSVTYPPRQARDAEVIPAILEQVEGVESIVCTMATTNILYIGERFDPKVEELDHLLEISEKWNAAIELIRIGGEEGVEDGPGKPSSLLQGGGLDYNGGIMDDDEGPPDTEDMGKDVSETMDRLIQAGRAGGYRSIVGGTTQLTASLAGKESCSLVVVGDVFTSKGGAGQRLKRDFVSVLSDRFRVPVIDAEELKARYLFGPRQVLNILVFSGLCALIYTIVFKFQEPILNFISAGYRSAGTLASLRGALLVAILVPLTALTVGGLYRNLLKLIKLE